VIQQKTLISPIVLTHSPVQMDLLTGPMSAFQQKHALRKLIIFKLHVKELRLQEVNVFQPSLTLVVPPDNNVLPVQMLLRIPVSEMINVELVLEMQRSHVVLSVLHVTQTKRERDVLMVSDVPQLLMPLRTDVSPKRLVTKKQVM